MNLVNRVLLERLKRKNRGNTKLVKAIDKLIDDIQANNWNSQIELKETRKDADCVHSAGFYFFNLNVYRTMILIEFDENKRVRIIWAGSHQDYVRRLRITRIQLKSGLKTMTGFKIV